MPEDSEVSQKNLIIKMLFNKTIPSQSSSFNGFFPSVTTASAPSTKSGKHRRRSILDVVAETFSVRIFLN